METGFLKRLRCFGLVSVLLIGLLSIIATGGGGGGGSDGNIINTEPGTTPLNDSDDSSVTGTYSVTSFDFYYLAGGHFSSANLDSFSWQMTMDIAADYTTYKVEWHDSDYGDYYDYGESILSSVDPDSSWDAAYYEITGDYTVAFYYDNFCSEGTCANVILRMQKITDEIKSLFGQQAIISVNNNSDTKRSVLRKSVLNIRF